MLMMRRYVRMRSYFHAKQCARNQLRKKRLKTYALRKNLKTLHQLRIGLPAKCFVVLCCLRSSQCMKNAHLLPTVISVYHIH